jgi:multidrug efflux pump subunit AcrB
VVLYADNVTGSMERAIAETNRRRSIQVAYNRKHGIIPKTIIKKIHDITEELDLHKKTAQLSLRGRPAEPEDIFYDASAMFTRLTVPVSILMVCCWVCWVCCWVCCLVCCLVCCN